MVELNKTIAIEEIGHGVANPLRDQSSHYLEAICINDGELQERPDRPLKKSDDAAIGVEMKKQGRTVTSVYYHEGGELFAEDFDQYMAVLPEVVTPTKEITIDNIYVGNPVVPLTDGQEKL